MNKIIALYFLVLSSVLNAQTNKLNLLENALNQFDFIEQQIIQEDDTITYYLKNYRDVKPTKLFVFIQGTDANPIFSYSIKDGKTSYYRWFGDDYKFIDSLSTFVIIPKPGMEGIYRDGETEIPEKYYRNNFKEYRVNQIDKTIDDVISKHLKFPEKVIVYGHSEGATIAAALALKNEAITHIGFWSGNVLNNFYEFSLFNRIESLKENISDSLAHENIMGIIDWYQSVITNPNSTELDHFGFTNKRWSTYERPPIEELLDVEIPIYALFATEDESTPIETAYLLPIQFMEKRKDNLTFEVCINCNHSYIEEKENLKINHWERIFNDFIAWTEKN